MAIRCSTQLNTKSNYTGIVLQDIISCEYLLQNEQKKHILNGASIEIAKNEILGISGRTRLELIVLIEVLGNMRSYYKGKARLSKLGTLRKKRRIVDEIFYIDSPNMLQGGMTVLEQLMFATFQKKVNVFEKQKNMMDLLIALDMKSLMLKKIDKLSYNQRLIVAIIIAILSHSDITVVNIVDQEFTQEEILLLKNVANYAKSVDKGLVVATMQPKLIGMAFANVAYTIDGKIICHEPVDELCARLDNVLCVVQGADNNVMKNIIEHNLPSTYCYESDNMLVISCNSAKKVKIGAIYEALENNGVDCNFVKINKGRVSNSFQELVARYDL